MVTHEPHSRTGHWRLADLPNLLNRLWALIAHTMEHDSGADDPESVLVTEFYGDTPAKVNAKIAHLERDLAHHTAGCRIYRFTDQASQYAIWQMRKAQTGLLARRRGDIKPLSFIEDVAVPVEQLAAYIRDIVRVCDDLGVEVTMGAHASAGCLHVLPFVNLKRADDIEKMRQISRAMAERVLLPAIRAAADAVVIAAGVSCRQQIGDLAGRVAIHPAEALSQRLRREPAERLIADRV